MISKILLVGLGGGLGSIFRFLVSYYTNKHTETIFPWATFAVNLTGCLLIGLFVGFSQKYFSEDLRILLVVGFCGGYTTFSTFSIENFQLLESGNYLTLALYAGLSVAVGIFAVWGGVLLARMFQ